MESDKEQQKDLIKQVQHLEAEVYRYITLHFCAKLFLSLFALISFVCYDCAMLYRVIASSYVHCVC